MNLKLSYIDYVLILFLVSISIFRINLIPYDIGFTVTPGLLVSLVVNCIGFVMLFSERPLPISSFYPVILLIIFIVWCLLFAGNTDFLVSIKRLILLVNVSFSSLSFYYLISKSKNWFKIFRIAIALILFIYFIFSIALYFSFFLDSNKGSVAKDEISSTFLNLVPQTISYLFPRISGGFMDPNVAGYFLVFLYFINSTFKFYKSYNFNLIIFIFIVASLSRSAIVLFLLIYLINLFSSDIGKFINLLLKTFSGFVFLFLVGFLLLEKFELTSSVVQTLEVRFNTEGDGSSDLHFDIMHRAKDLILDNTYNFLTGYGYGTSFLFLEDIFGSKYGNFHSEYLTVLFEIGICGAAIYFAYLIIPVCLLLNRVRFMYKLKLLTLVAAMLLSNIFYQQISFHYYWLLLTMPWYIYYKVRFDTN